jgi:hypothetical protein
VPNQVTLTFGGDADQLVKEAKRAAQSTEATGTAATTAGQDYSRAAGQSQQYADRMAKLGATVDGASTAIGDAAGTMQALADVTTFSDRKAMELARTMADLEQAHLDTEQAAIDLDQAQRDLNQSLIDADQATLDATQADQDREQALLDAATAQTAYNDAVTEHGAGSEEARQAALDLNQANIDAEQALIDATQAQEDAWQATEDGRQANLDAAQATRDAADAQLDANEAMAAANPPELAKWAEQLNLYAPLLQGLVGIIALVTAAQWAWNVAMTANPIGLVIAGIALLVGAVVLIATKTDWFQRAWSASWGWIKDAAANTWEFVQKIPGWTKDAFSAIGQAILWPYKQAFNGIAWAWNNTVGRLSWSVPDWIPGIGGNHIAVPQLPTFHTGGRVQGAPGQEVLALLQAGETVLPTQNGGGGLAIEIHSGGTAFDDLLVEVLARAIRARGGDPAALNLRMA